MSNGNEKNFGLSEAEFQQMVEQLRQGGGQLFEKIFLAHFPACTAYLENHCGASREDAYDASMETLLQFRQLLVAGKVRYQNLRFLFTRMAAQWYWRWRKNQPAPQPVEGFEPQASSEDQFDEESLETLEKSWEKLGEDCRRLLHDFYYNGLALTDLAKQLDQTDAALRQKKKRCLDKLQAAFFKAAAE